MIGAITGIPDEYLEALVSRKMSGTELQVVLALAKLTLGAGRESVRVTVAEIARTLRSTPEFVRRVLRDLREAGMLERSRALRGM